MSLGGFDVRKVPGDVVFPPAAALCLTKGWKWGGSKWCISADVPIMSTTNVTQEVPSCRVSGGCMEQILHQRDFSGQVNP